MQTRIADLKYKEVINVGDGSRYGYVGDVEFDDTSGQIQALVVPGRLRLFGLLGREEDVVIPWTSVKRFGEDLVLVEGEEIKNCPAECRRWTENRIFQNSFYFFKNRRKYLRFGKLCGKLSGHYARGLIFGRVPLGKGGSKG